MVKVAKAPSDVPDGSHWAIITFGSVSIPGDERSRTHPGHGYPAYTLDTAVYTVYDTEAEWRADILKLIELHVPRWVPLVVTRATIQTTITVSSR